MIDKIHDEGDKPLYSISSAARMLDISVHTLRMYEKEGLILPFKKSTSHRLYSQHDIDRIKCVRQAIKEKKFTIPGIKAIYSLIPCWQIKQCPVEGREKCSAYTGHLQPCWTYKNEDTMCAHMNCRECEIYMNFNRCEHIKNYIREITSNL